VQPIRILAFVASAATYLLIVLGGIVRITGSGMGCGDDWPLCNGRLIPPLGDTATFIEWSHRLVAAGVSAFVIGLVALTLSRRSTPGVAGKDGPLNPVLWAAGLLVIQVLLGAVTVWLELPPTTVVLHLATAMAMVAALVVAGLRASSTAGAPTDGRHWRGAMTALVMAGIAVLLGALTANLGAAGACLGFPLCSGEVWPSQSNGGLAHIHWVHRLVAYALVAHLIGLVIAGVRRGAPALVRHSAVAALWITALQVSVGAAMMLSVLQPHWRATHVAAGTAVWIATVVLAWAAQPREQRP
jgi:heme A synthase